MFNPGNPEFWVMISFILFVALIVYYGVPGLITKALDDRAEGIRKELDEARRLREEAQALLADYKKKAEEAEQEAQVIIEQAQREAEALAAETRQGLADSLERRTRLAEEKIERAEAQAIGEVRANAVDVALSAAEKIIKGRADGALGGSLIEQSIADLKTKLN